MKTQAADGERKTLKFQMGLHPSILDKMAANRFSRLQKVRDKAEILERHIQHMRQKIGATHTVPKYDNRPGKRKRQG